MGEVLVFSLLVLASLRSASTEEKFFKEGGSVTLELRPAPSVPITITQWKFNESILAEWVKDVLPLAHNRDNIKLDIVSGRLSMEKMTKADAGVYSVEVNSIVQKVTYNVLVIKDVPKPEITFFPLVCSDELDKCTLKCEGDTTGAEPVTYSWKTGDGEWIESEKAKVITKKEHGAVKDFTCKMENPVSEKVSDPHPNRLFIIKKEEKEGSSTGGIVGGIFFLLFLLGAGVGSYWGYKNDKFPCVKRNVDPESPAINGNATTPNDGADEMLMGETSTNTSPDAKQGSQEGPAGGAAPPKPYEDKPDINDEPAKEADSLKAEHEDKPVINDEPAEEADPLKPSHEDKPVIKDAPPPEEEADAELDAKP